MLFELYSGRRQSLEDEAVSKGEVGRLSQLTVNVRRRQRRKSTNFCCFSNAKRNRK